MAMTKEGRGWRTTNLGRLDVVVEVVAEGLDVRDVIPPALYRQVTGEEHWLVSETGRERARQPIKLLQGRGGEAYQT